MATTKKKTASKAKSSSGGKASKSPAAKKTSTKKKTTTVKKSSATSKASAAKPARSTKKASASKPARATKATSKTSKSKSPASKTASPRSAASAKGTKARPKAAPKRKDAPAEKGVISSIVGTVTNIFTSDTSKGINAVDLLKADHDVVEDLFARVKENEDGNNAAVFAKIKAELDVHAHIEETIFYPFLLEKGDKELKKIVREGIEEHRQVKLFLAELASLPGDNAKFKAKLKVLMEDVEHHVKEEEGEMFPMVEDQIEEPVLESMGARMQAEKARFSTGSASIASAR